MQNRELSWLAFNERVLMQGADESVPPLERLNFVSIFWSNLQEFFMVRIGSLTDLSMVKPPLRESKTNMTPKEQIRAVHKRCHELYPVQETIYEHLRGVLAKQGVKHLRIEDITDEQHDHLLEHFQHNIVPFLSPQVVNARHPFPHLENGKLYVLVQLEEPGAKKVKKSKAAENVTMGIIPVPVQCERIVKLPGRGFQFILIEDVIEMFAAEVFSMYKVKKANIICVTRNADIDANKGYDDQDDDYRSHMSKLLKQRTRLAPVRLESKHQLPSTLEKTLLDKLDLKPYQVYNTLVPLDLSYTWGLGEYLSDKKRAKLSNVPFDPAWPPSISHDRTITEQVLEHDILLAYPYHSIDPFVQLLREAASDPCTVSISITLYRLARTSSIAEALIAAAENGKEVTTLCELRARFDEQNNIEWSKRFEQAGCHVIYGFKNYKVHSKICSIVRKLPDGTIQHITQFGTGNYNEKTSRLYTDFSFITADEEFGRDADVFFNNMRLENISDDYEGFFVAPLQIKQMLVDELDKQIALAKAGKPAYAFLKANSVTDKDIIEKVSEASCAGVKITMLIRGICCLVPGVPGATENVRVVSIVGRLLEHSRIYCFGTPEDCSVYLSSADLMTRNLDKRVEIAWPLKNEEAKAQVIAYLRTCMEDTVKLREMRPNTTYTPLGSFIELDEDGDPIDAIDSQAQLIEKVAEEGMDLKEIEETE